MEHMEMKISQPIFVSLVAVTKNKVMKICNEPGIKATFMLGMLSSAELG